MVLKDFAGFRHSLTIRMQEEQKMRDYGQLGGVTVPMVLDIFR